MKDLTIINHRIRIEKFEKKVSNMPGAMHGDCFPLEHTFGNGMYMRKITVPAGAFLIGKIHKYDHPSFMLEGEVSVITPEGVKRIKAPLSMMAKAGEKRVGFVHKKMVWVDVFTTNETTPGKVEAECVVNTYREFDMFTFRELTKRVIAAEKPGFWSDWTKEQQGFYISGDWKAFSRSRGYSETEIVECEEWLNMIKENKQLLLSVKDLVDEAALKNISLDTKGEILRSSQEVLCHS